MIFNDVVLSSLISAIVTLSVCLITNRSDRKKTDALIGYRLEMLEKKVDKHNNLIERVYELEKRTDLQEEQIKVANHRIGDLEKGE